MRRLKLAGIRATTATPGASRSPPQTPHHPSQLGDRLTPLGIDARSGRRAALLQLASQLPAPVIADALGITATTRHRLGQSRRQRLGNDAAATTRNVAQPREEPHQMQHP